MIARVPPKRYGKAAEFVSKPHSRPALWDGVGQGDYTLLSRTQIDRLLRLYSLLWEERTLRAHSLHTTSRRSGGACALPVLPSPHTTAHRPRSGVVMRSAPCQVERTPRRTSLPDAALAVELRPVPVQTTAAHRSGQLHFESTGWCSGDSEFTPIRRCLHILFRVRQTLETKTPSHHSSWCEGVFLFFCRGDLRDLVRLSTGSMRWRALYTADREAGASSGSAGK